MLDKFKVIESLERKKEEFMNFKSNHLEDLATLYDKYHELSSIPEDEIKIKLENQTETPGALPADEWDNSGLLIKFDYRWDNHTEARSWAYDILLEKTTFAVDGSQITPSRDFSPPVGAVQIAKFENPHSYEDKYTKELYFDVISPQELSNSLNLFPQKEPFTVMEQYIAFKRFELETATIIEYMKENAHKKLKPVVFFDGGLIISFVIPEKFKEGEENELYKRYIELACGLLETSEKYKVPLIGFIDHSTAHDLVNMVRHYFDKDDPGNIIDAQLVSNNMIWGDRTPVFHCRRHGVLLQYGEYKDKICFCYLKTNDKQPARLEFPLWLYEDKELFQQVLNIVRAETIVGSGYIYSIESADQVAAITSEDKKYFYNIFSQFAIEYDLGLNLAQKAISKSKRR